MFGLPAVVALPRPAIQALLTKLIAIHGVPDHVSKRAVFAREQIVVRVDAAAVDVE
jgi:hypothetical protein